MIYKNENQYGNIIIKKKVIIKIINEVMKKYENKITTLNYETGAKSFVMNKIGKKNNQTAIEISLSNQEMNIKIYTVIKFGNSIAITTNSLINDIHEAIYEFIGIEPKSVAIVVTGVESKNIAKRKIEVQG